MNNVSKLPGFMLGVVSLALSTSVWACSMDKLGNVSMTNGTHMPEYKVTDNTHVRYLDGLKNGRAMSDEGAMMHRYDCMKGDTVTNLRTQKSGVVTGVKDQGTMDVTTSNGKTVRYQYVTFKVRPM